MKLKWGNEKMKYFSTPIKKVERKSDDWAWWSLFIAFVIMEIMFILSFCGKI